MHKWQVDSESCLVDGAVCLVHRDIDGWFWQVKHIPSKKEFSGLALTRQEARAAAICGVGVANRTQSIETEQQFAENRKAHGQA